MTFQDFLIMYSMLSTGGIIALYLDNKHNNWWKNYYKNCNESNEKLINEHINKQFEL